MVKIHLSTNLVVPSDRRFLAREEPTEDLLKIVNVDPGWLDYVRVLDRQGNLALLHYLTTFISEEDQTIDEAPLKKLGHLRGLIVDTDAGMVVCRSYPYTPEILSGKGPQQ